MNWKQRMGITALAVGQMVVGQMAGADQPEVYGEFADMATVLVEPLIPLLERDHSILDLTGPASDHGLMADKLESVARPGLLLALWLQLEGRDDETVGGMDRAAVAAWYRRALVLGTDPASDQYWGGLTNYHQHGVEMAIMTMSLTVARDHIWDTLSQAERDQVARWLGGMRGSARYWNNHLYFAILVLEFLRAEGYGQPGDAEAIDFMFEQLEGMHMGNGWFKDGINETYDHYNAYAFHTYGMWWALQYGHTDPARAACWTGWARSFIQDYAHLYAASGEHLAYGRSITYRFNGLGVFGLAAKLDLGVLPLGEMRRICRKNLEFFLARPIQQEQGCLSIGFTDEFPGIAEPYSCAGSPYWAAKGLLMLSLPPEHPFWSEPEQPYPAERGDFVRVVPAPRFVIRGINGEVELLNGGSQVARNQVDRYGPWKWSKMSYRTGLGFTVSDDLNRYPTDAVLTVERPATGERMGRHSTVPILTESDHMAYLYALGTRENEFNLPVRTDLFWKGGWLLAVHQVNAPEPVRYLQGGWSLGLAEAGAGDALAAEGSAVARKAGWTVIVQPLAGYDTVRFDRRDEAEPRRHLYQPYHLTPVVVSETAAGPRVLASLLYAGMDAGTDAALWTLESAVTGRWVLRHPALGEWSITDPALPALEF